jgi:tetratricopeptide (TPR) repeat protein
MFVITLSLFISYVFVLEIRKFLGKISYIFPVIFISLSFFVVVYDERGQYISKLEKMADSQDIELSLSALSHLASIYEYERNIGDAVRTYMEMIKRNPHDDRTITRLAVILIHTGKIDLAIPLVKRALSLNPENKEARMLETMLEKFLEETEKNKAEMEKEIEKTEGNRKEKEKEKEKWKEKEKEK